VDKFIEKTELNQAQAQAMNAAGNKIQELAKQYPGIAAEDFKVAKEMAATLIPKGITVDQYVDILSSIGPTLPAPRSEPQRTEAKPKPPTSLRGDSGLPGIVNTPTPQFGDGKAGLAARGRHIEDTMRKAMRG
jgi:hypothetical protein